MKRFQTLHDQSKSKESNPFIRKQGQELRSRFYQSRQWKEVRSLSKGFELARTQDLIVKLLEEGHPHDTIEEVLEGNQPHCTECFKSYHQLVPATVCDHIKPIMDGGSKDSIENLQWLCDSHHKTKTVREFHARKNKRNE